MKRKIVLAALIALTALAGVCLVNFLPVFATKVVTITEEGGFAPVTTVATLYSNRLVVYKSSLGGLFASRMRLSKSAFAEILSQAGSFPHEGHLTSPSGAVHGFDGYVWSLEIDGKTYYTSFREGDEPLDNLLSLVHRHIAPLLKDFVDVEEPQQDEEVVVKSHTVANSAIHGDLSASWTIPFDVEGIDSMHISLVDSEGDEKEYSGSLVAENTISATDMIEYLAATYPRKLQYVRFNYISWPDETAGEYNYIDIDVSMIEVNQSGEPLNLLTLKKTGGSGKWLSLGGADIFREGNYYCVTAYRSESDYGERCVFKAEHAGQTYEVESWRWGGALERVFLQEVAISGDPVSGFEVVFTPEPEKPFEVVQ